MSADKPYRSVSQYNQYTRCPYSYYLARILKVWQRPAAWLPQGSAVHEAAEAYERSGRTMTLAEVEDSFREAYSREVGKYCDTTPNFDYWSASGRYRGEEDVERRYGIGLEQTAKYLAWYEQHPNEVIWIAPDGTPGIELAFDIDLDGIPIRGFIDAVIDVEDEAIISYDGGGEKYGTPKRTPKLIVRDNKTGNNPGDDFQLGVYSVALQEMYGLFGPYLGDYWMGRSGKATHPYDLTGWTRDRVAAAFRELEDNIQAERFDPLPEPDKCRFCSVSYSCEFRA